MFALAIVVSVSAAVLLVLLTAFVPKFRAIVQLVSKKVLLGLLTALLFVFVLAPVQLLLWGLQLITVTALGIGKLIAFLGIKFFTLLENGRMASIGNFLTSVKKLAARL
jgi:hypothetical protein